jgi:hypothetical protein
MYLLLLTNLLPLYNKGFFLTFSYILIGNGQVRQRY